MTNICRTCMSKKKEMISIFNQHKSPSISEMIMAISAIEFLPNDTLPPQMCITCIETLEIAYYFKNQVISSNNVLHEQAHTSKLLVPQVNEIEENEEFYKGQIELSTEHITFNAYQSKCPESLISAGTHDTSAENDIKSLNLQLSLSRKSQQNDVDTHFDTTCIKTEEADDTSGQSEDNCTTISIKYKSDDEFSSEDELPLMLHVKTESCHRSEEVQQDSNKNSEVATEASKGDAPYKCSYCKKLFHGESLYTSHIAEHKLRNKCEVCEKGFTSRSALLNHMRMHTGETPFECQHCDARFMYRNTLKDHIRMHTGGTRRQPHKCEICGKAFEKPNRLQMHIRSHTGEKPFKCHLCDTSYAVEQSLKKHIRMHAGEVTPKPYMCEICGNTYYAPCQLAEHMRSHTGERPFKCQFCDASYAQSAVLNRHVLWKHSDEGRAKPHKCEVCEKPFATLTYLKQHMLCHTEERPFRCQDCNAGFKRVTHLKRHIRLHTGEALTKTEK